MSRFFFSLTAVFLAVASLFAQAGINWSQPSPVAASSAGDDSPRIALLADGSPVVLWGHNSKIFFSRMVDGSFTSPSEVSTNGTSPDIYVFGGLDLATHADQVFLVFENFDSGVHLIRSTDGGQTFENPVSVYDPPSGLWTTISSVATDDAGNPLVSVIRELPNETQASYILMHSTDGGASFSPPTVASEPAPGDFVCECCPSDIFSKGDDVWLIFRNNDNNLRDMWVSRSTDGGATFTTATDVDDTDWVVNACPISGPKLAPMAGDSLLTVWMSGASGGGRVSFSTLHGGTMGKGWEMEFPLTGTTGSQVRPDVAGQNDTIGVVWEESGFGGNSVDLLFAFSKNGPPGLAANFANLTMAPGPQRYPSLAYSQGVFHLVYADGAGGLKYLRGIVSDVNAGEEVFAEQVKVEVAPHPVLGGEIRLSFGVPPVGEMDFQLFDAAGKMVRQWKSRRFSEGKKYTLEVGSLAAGVYFLEVFAEGKRWLVKVVLAR